jgi:serine/threonine protein kinase
MALRREAKAEPIPGYRLISPLGAGGFGEVWMCEAPGGLHKAVKFVFGNLNALDSEGHRAAQEFNALQRIKALRHPFILSIERIEIIDGEVVIIMELADKNLYDRFVECQSANLPGIPRDELLGYLLDSAEVLDLMNFQHDLQHLDIKPRNLFLLGNRVKVADFGLVKDLESLKTPTGKRGFVAGVTPLYSSPETLKGIISRHSDQYSLAIVYQELLTGCLPFQGKTPRQLALMHTNEPPNLTSLPEADQPIVAKALCKNPQHRFPTCLAFVRALVEGRLPKPEEENEKSTASRSSIRLSWHVPSSLEEMLLHGEPTGREAMGDSPRGKGNDQSRLSVTVAQPSTGALRPTLILGLGGFGRQTVQALRCRFIDRFGTLAKMPIIRYLLLDTDAKNLERALLGPVEEAVSETEIFNLPLQGMGQYRRNRPALDQLTTWLPLEKLYALPRSLETDGNRAFGRLALHDNYLRLAARLRREIQLLSDPASLDHAVNETGLPARSETPQVYIVGTAGGGSGSGMLIDLGYTVRRLLREQGHADAEVIAFLECGAPADPATPSQELANLYATLTEINHFSDPDVEFAAQYGVAGAAVREQGAPFQSCYLLTLDSRGPEVLGEASKRIAAYMFHDLSSPFGARMARSRENQLLNRGTPFRSFGTFTLWYPRGLLLRTAARQACEKLLRLWTTIKGNLHDSGSGEAERFELEPASDEALARAATALEGPHRYESLAQTLSGVADQLLLESAWQPEHLRKRIEQAASGHGDGSPGQALTAFLANLDAQVDLAIARDDPAGWCRQAVDRLREWVGSGVSALEETTEWRKSKLHRIFAAAVQQVADTQIEFLSKPAQQICNQPGFRLAASNELFEQLIHRCDARVQELKASIKSEMRQTEEAWKMVDSAMEACLRPGSFVFFAANRTRKLLRTFLDRLTTYARQRLSEEAARSVQYLYSAIRGRLRDLQRDLAFCQQRLSHLAECLVQRGEAAIEEAHSQHVAVVGVAAESGGEAKPAHAEASSRRSRTGVTSLLPPSSRHDSDEPADAEERPGRFEEGAGQFLEEITADQWFELDVYLQSAVLTPAGGLYHSCTTSSDLARTLGTPLLDAAAEFLGKLLPLTDVCEAELSTGRDAETSWREKVRSYYTLAAPSVRARRRSAEQTVVLVPESSAGQKLAAVTSAALSPEGSNANPALSQPAVAAPHIVHCGSHTDLFLCREQGEIGQEDLRDLLKPCKHAYRASAAVPHTSPHSRCDIIDWVPLEM